MNERVLRTLAIATGALSAALALTSVALIALSLQTVSLEGWGFPGYDAAFALVFAAVGLLVTTRRTGNLIGWLFLVAAMTSGLQTLTASYASYAIGVGAPGVAVARWITDWIWIPSIATIIFALLLFPNGRPASPRWRAVVVGLIPVAAIATLLWALAPPSAEDPPGSQLNPLGLEPGGPLELATVLSTLALATWLALAAASLWSRMRRGGAIERQQIKWIAYATALLGPALAASVVSSVVPTPFAVEKATQVLAIVTVLFIPIAAAIAILRHRLYDIDLLINRTLVYAATSATLVLTYIVVVLTLGAALRPFAQQSEVAVAGSTLAVAALVQPLRRRVQTAVDRRFYRSRYDAERTVDRFALRLREEVDLDALRGELVGVVRETVRPAHASLWLRGRSE